MRYHDLLAGPRLSVISAEPDGELDRIAGAITASVRIDGPDALAALLDGLIAAGGSGAAAAPRTLDLIGHATGAAQLRLGRWVIDAASAGVTRWFGGLAAREVCPRLGIRAVRLLGCHTAGSEQGRATICALADLLGVEVLGARELLHAGHYDRQGFGERWEFLLVPASRLRRTPDPATLRPGSRPGPHTLDLDALPVLALGSHEAGAPRRMVTAAATREILALVQRDAGAPIPGLSAAPLCELALPAARSGGYHLAEVLLGGAFLRLFPDGAAAAGIAYPVRDAGALLAILDGPGAPLTP